jgi:quaternary ammonium compound-resistance protein SugE
MAWTFLILAGLLEIVWLFTMKLSEGFTRLGWTLVTAAVMVASFVLLSASLKAIPTGTAYAVWTGIGAVGAAVVGILWFKEPAGALRLASIGAIVLGIAGLKLTAAH